MVAKIERFEDLEVWQLARTIAKGVFRAGRTQKLGREFALFDQMKRAAVSISSNIAEGFERGSRKQFIESCFIAKGSAGELRSQVTIAFDAELLTPKAFEWFHEQCDHCSRMLANYIRQLQKTSTSFRGMKYKRDKVVGD